MANHTDSFEFRWERWWRMISPSLRGAACLLVAAIVNCDASGADNWMVGVAKVDITPTKPVRLSGYGNRSKPTLEIDDPLSARAFAFRQGREPTSVLVSIDAIGLSPTLSDRIGVRLEEKHQVSRSRLVLCTTHTHTAPHLEGVLPNLLATPLSESENANMLEYSQRLVDSVVDIVERAIHAMEPATLEYGTGSASFAVNRRVIQNGAWTGFGVAPGGPVDRSVRVIQAKNVSGETLAVLFQYACHCTSIAPDRNKISADWAGMSATRIEQALGGDSSRLVALPIIGCGADANPNPRNTYENAIAHADEMSQAVVATCKRSLTPLPPLESQTYELVAIATERPSRDRLKQMTESSSVVERRFGTNMLDTLGRKGRLPETYPAPVHVWRFGGDLAWVFLGGEVVVDYQMRLERELSQFKNVWVAAYTDDVFAYIASERLRAEGGYEVDASMLYYQQPGRWVTGTEDVLVSRVLDLARNKRSLDLPLSPAQGLASIQMSEGWQVEQVACEPAVQDPVNVAFGADGTVWVLEMGDYPLGGPKAGLVKRLMDRDGDGKYESSSIFLDNLSYPAGLYPWRDGIIVACAPDVFWARDLDKDGVADDRQILISGFPFANPQHRVHGFTYGLDHRLHFGTGSSVKELVEQKTGRRVQASGSDLSLNVESGEVSVETGSTQYIRGCDEWGNWFGNDNSHPLFHYAWDRSWSKFTERSPRTQVQHVMEPATAPPVYPISRDADRFNDLFAANRFTSACSTIFCRSPGALSEMNDCALVCEPVHNLVARFQIKQRGASFVGSRLPQDQQSEWMRSSDPWFRPVRIENAPDGTLWVVDMYRRVIEHPEWIPDDWQRRLDLRAGQNQGRIYRAYRTGFSPLKTKDWTGADENELLQNLSHPSSAIADIVRQQLIWRCNDGNLSVDQVSKKLTQILSTTREPQLKLRIAATLASLGTMSSAQWCALIEDSDGRVARWAVESVAKQGLVQGDIRRKLAMVSESPLAKESASLALQLIVALSTCNEPDMKPVGNLLALHAGDRWIDAAVSVLPVTGIDTVIETLLNHAGPRTDGMLNTLISKSSPQLQSRLREQIIQQNQARPAWQFQLSRQFANSQNPKLGISEETANRLSSEARALLESKSSPLELRQAALEWLVSRLKSEDSESFRSLMVALVDAPAQAFAADIVRGVMTLGSQGLDVLFQEWTQLDSEKRGLILSACTTKLPEALQLIDRLERKQIDVADFQPSHLESLRGMVNSSLQARVEKLFGPPPGADRAAIVRDYGHKWSSASDLVRGEALYKQHCAQCHQDRLDARGETIPSIGPNLQSLSGWVNEAWLTAIFDPNRAVEAKYRRVTVSTEDGQIRSGLKVRENSDTIDFVNDQGQLYSLPRAHIDQIKESEKSLMPEGFEKVLTPDDVVNIISFLRKK
jgi:putative membrane-bound dehydrogenase-like protein